MNNTVEVVRHIRKTDGWYPDISNMHGITVVFTIDYKDKFVAADWSVCHNVNFYRKEGIRRAKLNGQNFMIPLENVYLLGGLIPALSAGSESWGVDYDSMRVALNRVNDRIRRFKEEDGNFS